ncbi:MAG: hypothetical protein ACOYBY_18615, partial [Dermatophilaceae bacterium]
HRLPTQTPSNAYQLRNSGQVWDERDATVPPPSLPPLPPTWPARFERLAAEHHLDTTTFTTAVARLNELWSRMFPNEER